MSASTMAIGVGKMNSETSSALHSTCQITRMANNSSHGARVLAAALNWVGFFIWSRSQSSIAHAADMFAQFVHQRIEGIGIGQFQLAWTRQRVDLARDNAARTFAHDINGVGQESGFTQIVGDQDDVEAALAPQIAQHAP